jgi:hypothetical protein
MIRLELIKLKLPKTAFGPTDTLCEMTHPAPIVGQKMQRGILFCSHLCCIFVCFVIKLKLNAVRNPIISEFKIMYLNEFRFIII